MSMAENERRDRSFPGPVLDGSFGSEMDGEGARRTFLSCGNFQSLPLPGLIGLSACVPRLVAWQIEDEQYIPLFREELKD